jgi:hypothetical protein
MIVTIFTRLLGRLFLCFALLCASVSASDFVMVTINDDETISADYKSLFSDIYGEFKLENLKERISTQKLISQPLPAKLVASSNLGITYLPTQSLSEFIGENQNKIRAPQTVRLEVDDLEGNSITIDRVLYNPLQIITEDDITTHFIVNKEAHYTTIFMRCYFEGMPAASAKPIQLHRFHHTLGSVHLTVFS